MKKTKKGIQVATVLILTIILFSPRLKSQPNAEITPFDFKNIVQSAEQMDYDLLTRKQFEKKYGNSEKPILQMSRHSDIADKINNYACGLILNDKIMYDYIPSWTLFRFDSVLSLQLMHYQAYYNRAVVYSIQGDYDLALSDFEIAKIGLNSSFHGILHLNRGILFCKNKEYFKAICEFNIAEQTGRRDKELYYNRGLAKYEYHDFNGAIIDFKKAYSMDKKDGDICLALANSYLQTARNNKACKYYRRAWNINPNNLSYSLSYGRILLVLSKYRKAEKVFNFILKTDKTNINALYGKGDALMGLRKFEKALNTYKKISLLEPFDYNSYIRIGDTYFLDKKYEKAIDYYRESQSLDTVNPISYRGISIAYQNIHEPDSCIKYYKKSIEKKGAKLFDSKDLVMIGNAALEIKNYNIASNLFNIVYTSDSSNVDAINGIGVILMEKGFLKEAMDCFNKVLFIDDNYAQAYANIGQCLHYQYRYKESIVCLEKAYKLDKNNKQILNDLAMAYNCLEDSEKALEYMQLALTVEHDNPLLLSNLSIVYSSLSLDNINNKDTNIRIDYYNKAIANIEKALSYMPDSPSLKNNRGVINMTNRNYKEALVDFNYQMEVHQNNAGIAYAMLGDYFSARKSFTFSINNTFRLNYVPRINLDMMQTVQSKDLNNSSIEEIMNSVSKEFADSTHKHSKQPYAYTHIYYYHLPKHIHKIEKTSFSYNYPIIVPDYSKYVLEFICINPEKELTNNKK